MSSVKVVCLHCAQLAAKNNCQLKTALAKRDVCVTAAQVTGGIKKKATIKQCVTASPRNKENTE